MCLSRNASSLYIVTGAHPTPYLIDIGVPGSKPVALPSIADGLYFEADAWSPDGKWLSGWAAPPERSHQPGPYIFDIENRTYRMLAEIAAADNTNWLPDSRRIVVLSSLAIKVVDRVSGTVTSAGLIGTDIPYPMKFRLSVDGRSHFANSAIGERDIWRMEYEADESAGRR